MTLSVGEARNLMGKANEKYSDDEIENIINIFVVVIDLAIDTYLEKRKTKERKSL